MGLAFCFKCCNQMSDDAFHSGDENRNHRVCGACRAAVKAKKHRSNYKVPRDKGRIAEAAWRSRNPDKLREQWRRRRATPHGKIRQNIMRRVREVLRGQSKSATTIQLLGCSVKDFQIYLESKWEIGMSWGNYGLGNDKWNIDHIMPCAIFDLSKPEHQRRCFHFSNMQPMWQIDNIRKSNKVEGRQLPI